MSASTLSPHLHPGSSGDRTAAARHAAALGLVAALALGSLVMWIAIPAAWLWLTSQASDEYLTIYGAALVGAPLTMVAWGWCLHRINRAYLRVSGRASGPPSRASWLRPSSGPGEGRPVRDPLAVCMAASVVLALICLAAFLYFAGPGAAPGAW